MARNHYLVIGPGARADDDGLARTNALFLAAIETDGSDDAAFFIRNKAFKRAIVEQCCFFLNDRDELRCKLASGFCDVFTLSLSTFANLQRFFEFAPMVNHPVDRVSRAVTPDFDQGGVGGSFGNFHGVFEHELGAIGHVIEILRNCQRRRWGAILNGRTCRSTDEVGLLDHNDLSPFFNRGYCSGNACRAGAHNDNVSLEVPCVALSARSFFVGTSRKHACSYDSCRPDACGREKRTARYARLVYD